MIRYKHTNLIAKDWRALSGFYQRALNLTAIGQRRDLSASGWDRLTGIPGAHITGEHLKLPGRGRDAGDLFLRRGAPGCQGLSRAGFAHIASRWTTYAGRWTGCWRRAAARRARVVSVEYPLDVTATFVYAKDPEGNLIELQKLEKS